MGPIAESRRYGQRCMDSGSARAQTRPVSDPGGGPPAGSATGLAAAQEALVAGRWVQARDGFEAALATHESGEALFGLGLALWWLREPEASIRLQERAYRVFDRAGDAEQAFVAAMYLCLGYDMTFGNTSVSRGWLGRAARLAEDHALDPLRGWVHLCRAVTEHDDDLTAARGWARQALDDALTNGDTDLEVCARSELGAALVELGRLAEGAALLDEAMAGALGGGLATLDAVVLASCRTIVACSRAADVKRVTQWVRATTEFNERYGSPHLYTTCRTHYFDVLFLTGRWAQAEEEITAALSVGPLVEPALHAEAVARLASLRLAQGRCEEAARILDGYDQHPAAVSVLAAIRAAQGRPEVAVWLVRRRLRAVGRDGVAGVALLAQLVDLQIAAGQVEEAVVDARELMTLIDRFEVPVVAARARLSIGNSLAAAGDGDAAAHLEHALAVFVDHGLPHLVARCRLALARLMTSRDGAAAVEEARAALATFTQLGAAADEAAALLRSLGVRAARRGPNAVGELTGREREILALLGEGMSNRDIAARLFITPKTVEHHVGRVLTKLDLRRRAEAAAFAVRHLPSK